MVYSKKIKAKNSIDWDKVYIDLQGICGIDPVFSMFELVSEEYCFPEKFHKDIIESLELLQRSMVLLETFEKTINQYKKRDKVFRDFYKKVHSVPHKTVNEACHECVDLLEKINQETI